MYGGSAALAIATEVQWGLTVVSGSTHTTVERAEISAMLDGLSVIIDHWSNTRNRKAVRPRIFWYTDRESAALSAWRDETGEPFYRRKSAADLWARYAWFEQAAVIFPLFIPRDTDPMHNITDRLSSEARELVKNWAQFKISDKEIPYGKN